MPRRPSIPRPSLPRPSFSRPRLPRPAGPTPPSLWSDAARRAAGILAVGAVALIGFGIGYLVFDDPDAGSGSAPAPTALTIEGEPEPDAAAAIGFPAFATRNTTRVGGTDAASVAAGVALASYPAQGGIGAPQAAILAPEDSWQEALAATSLTADPLASPLLLGGPDEVPAITTSALTAIAPGGLTEGGGESVITVGDVVAPPEMSALAIEGADPAEVADAVDVQRAALTGIDDPDHLLVVTSEAPGYAMPAAAWAARSGDPILFAAGDDVPEPTLATIARHPDTPVYVLGPESVISEQALGKLGRKGATVTRVGSEGPLENAIAFARFVDGDFGWNINDPGHGFAIANTSRPADAAAAAPLAAGGKPGPLLLTDDAVVVPPSLSAFLADTQPGFIDDPTRAVYNHVWILGDETAISVAFQAQVDELTKLAPVSDSTEVPEFGGDGATDDSAAPPSDSLPGDDLPVPDDGALPEVTPPADDGALPDDSAGGGSPKDASDDGPAGG